MTMTLAHPAPTSPEPPRAPTVIALLLAVTAAVFVVVWWLLPDRDSGLAAVGSSSAVGSTTSTAGAVSTDEMLLMWSQVKLPCVDPLVIPGPPHNRYGLVPTADYPTAGGIAAKLKTITPQGDHAFVAEQLAYLNLILIQTQGDMTITDRDTSAAIDSAGGDSAAEEEAIEVGRAQLLADRTAYRQGVENAMTALSTGKVVEDPELAGVFYYGRTCTGMG